MSIHERLQSATDVAVLTAGLVLSSWFYYELYQAFRISSLVF